MNALQLSRNVGHMFRLRPIPFRVEASGEQLPQIDDQWRLDSVDQKPARVRLTNTRTGHQIELESDNISERRSPDFLILRCEITLRPDGIAIEPIQRGAPIIPAKTATLEARPRGQPKYVNMPPGYERRLNYHRYRIAKDSAAKDERGGYRFPVRVKGAEADVKAFQRDVAKRFGVFPTVSSFADGVGEVAFTYVGTDGPEAVENVAIKHRLIVLQCGNPFTM